MGLGILLAMGCTKKPVTSESTLLEHVADVPLPGAAVRFDYQDIDTERRRLVIAHMNDDAVVVVDLDSDKVVQELRNVPTPRGVAVGGDRIFVTSSPSTLVILNAATLAEIARVATGRAPDGVAYDSEHSTVGVSDQGDGALSLIADSGDGKRVQVPLGDGTGNVVYDPKRHVFWITVEHGSTPDEIVAVDPLTAAVSVRLAVAGCEGAHGLRLHPDAATAFVACEGNDKLARIDLASGEMWFSDTPSGPDVLSIDADRLYLASEGGDASVYDIAAPGLSLIGRQDVGDDAHTVQVDAATHRVFFPLERGEGGAPALRVMQPTAGFGGKAW
jgi:YVTN family beta-propeller protein